jgi:hypothetical protein
VIGLAGMAVAGLFSLIVSWWAGPFDRAELARFATFDHRDLVPVGYAGFAFAVGVAAGIVIRRTVPAMACALMTFVGARLAIAHWVRTYLLASAHTTLPLSSAQHLGFMQTPSGAAFVAGNPSIDNALILSTTLVDKAGHPASAQSIHHFVQTACPVIEARVSHPSAAKGPPAPKIFDDCIARISTKFHLGVTYQPPSHYWLLQWCEMAIFLAAALALAAFCFWWIRRRHV